MAFTIRRVDYFYTTVEDKPGTAYRLLSQLAELGIDLLALTAVPVGPMRAQLTLFPAETGRFRSAAKQANLSLDGPHRALLVQGDDSLGAVAEVHEKLADAGVNVYASTGASGGHGTYGYVLYVRPEQFDQAARALEV
jgi:hypothetical protein